MTETVAQPITAADIVDAIRGPHWITRDEAIELIERHTAALDLVKALQGSNAMLQLLRSMVEASETVACIDEQVKLNVAALASPSSAEGRE